MESGIQGRGYLNQPQLRQSMATNQYRMCCLLIMRVPTKRLSATEKRRFYIYSQIMKRTAISSKYDAFLYKKHMVQHRNALKKAGPRIDSKPPVYHKDKKSKSKSNRTRSEKVKKRKAKLSRHQSSHSIVDNKRKHEIQRQNQVMERYIMNTSFSIDNKEPVRLTKTLHQITRKQHQQNIQSKNRKIQHYLERTRSTIPNARELQQRWQRQKVLKQLRFDSGCTAIYGLNIQSTFPIAMYLFVSIV